MPSHKIHLSLPATDYDVERCWLGTRSYWTCQLLGWGGLFVLLCGPLPFKPHATAGEIASVAVFAVVGMALSHILRWVLINLLNRPARWFAFSAQMLPWLVVFSCAHVALQIAAAKTILPQAAVLMSSRPGQDPLLFTFFDTVSLSAGLFTVWTGAYIGLRVYRHYQAVRIERLQLAANVQEAAWQALRAQLNPHLLFNSLNSIRALIPRESTVPREAITHLSELLRKSLALKENKLVPLRAELQTVDSFLALERLRFERRLRVQQSVAADAADWLVPPFLVQILVENAVKFGVAPYEDGGEINLRIAVEQGTLVVEVINRGQLGSSRAPTSTGLGLANIRSRLALLFGPAASLTIENHGSDQVRARAVVPKPRETDETTPSAIT